MRRNISQVLIVLTSILLTVSISTAAPQVSPMSSAFSYQGRLEWQSSPFNGTCDFLFGLWDSATGGSQIGNAIEVDDQTVLNGLFSINLDFGATAFNGESRWLEIDVRCVGDDSFTTLPRQELTATPYAIYAQKAPWTGITGMPAGFSDGVDNDTKYTAGEGLSLSGTTFSIDPTLTIGETGSPPFWISIIDSDVSSEPSIIRGWDGFGLISYTSAEEGLKVAHCNDIQCSNATISTIDSVGSIGEYSSITLGPDAMGLISYYDQVNGDLKIAHCNDLNCSEASISNLDSIGDTGLFTSITVGKDGFGLISYYDADNADLKIAHCSDVICSEVLLFTLDSAGEVGLNTSITTGIDGLGLISYYDATNADLKIAHCSDEQCSSATISSVDTEGMVGYFSSITLGDDGKALISYSDASTGSLKVAHCENILCTTATLSTIVSSALDITYSAITIGSDRLGLISFYDGLNDRLLAAHCIDVHCSAAQTNWLDGYHAGMWSSSTSGSDGMGLIAYIGDGALKVSHCGNTFCIPFFRRR